MTAQIIDGKKIAEDIRNDIQLRIAARVENNMPKPGLTTVLIGDDPASQVYVRSKHKACEVVGIQSFRFDLQADTSQKYALDLIKELNSDRRIHGILVQLPLPSTFNEELVLSCIDLHKDVDGFHPINIGRLAQKGREPLYIPCTPSGVMHLLKKFISLDGKRAVVLGRSNIVGMPVSLLLIRENATVTICHSHTKELESIIHQADILVSAIGKPEFVRGDWVKHGAVIIDVGVNRVVDPSKKSGYRLVGDVAFSEVMEVASWVTPVPGGVGPMTIAMLLKNTLQAAERADIKVKLKK